MLRSYRHLVTALALPISLCVLTVSAAGPAATSASPNDGLSGTWQVSRTCLTICVSPKPVRKVVSHLSGEIFTTGGRTPQLLYRIGRQVLVHGPKDSLLLAIETPGLLMSGRGVGADGSTFATTWHCIAPAAPAVPVATGTALTTGIGGAATMGVSEPRPQQAPLGISRC